MRVGEVVREWSPGFLNLPPGSTARVGNSPSGVGKQGPPGRRPHRGPARSVDTMTMTEPALDVRHAPWSQPDAYAEAVVDLDAIRHNTGLLSATARGGLMAVVKANAFGHGAVPVARTALAGGATWLGVTSVAEALELREAGITAPVLAWMHLPDDDLRPVIGHDIDLAVATLEHLEAIASARSPARHRGRRPPQGRHRPAPRRFRSRRVARAGPPGSGARGPGRGPGPRRVVPPGPRGRTGQRADPPADQVVRRRGRSGPGCRARPPRSSTWPTPPPCWPTRRRTTTSPGPASRCTASSRSPAGSTGCGRR